MITEAGNYEIKYYQDDELISVVKYIKFNSDEDAIAAAQKEFDYKHPNFEGRGNRFTVSRCIYSSAAGKNVNPF